MITSYSKYNGWKFFYEGVIGICTNKHAFSLFLFLFRSIYILNNCNTTRSMKVICVVFLMIPTQSHVVTHMDLIGHIHIVSTTEYIQELWYCRVLYKISISNDWATGTDVMDRRDFAIYKHIRNMNESFIYWWNKWVYISYMCLSSVTYSL